MTSLKELRAILRDWVEDESIDDVFTNFANFAIQECETIVNFVELYAESSITVPDTGIFTEPARSREIIQVIPETTTGYASYQFKPRKDMQTQAEGYQRNYTLNPYPAFDTAEAEYTVSFTQGATTITKVGSTFFAAADVGKRVMLAEDSELYEIITVAEETITVSPAITTTTSTSTTASLNPAGTRRFILKDPSNVVAAGDMTVSYQKKHPKVYADASMLLIPCPRSVALIALQQALITNKYDVDAQRLDMAVMQAKNSELDNTAFKQRTNQRADSLFSVRSRR